MPIYSLLQDSNWLQVSGGILYWIRHFSVLLQWMEKARRYMPNRFEIILAVPWQQTHIFPLKIHLFRFTVFLRYETWFHIIFKKSFCHLIIIISLLIFVYDPEICLVSLKNCELNTVQWRSLNGRLKPLAYGNFTAYYFVHSEYRIF